MSKAEQKKLLNDKWPNANEAKKKAMFAAIEKASKAKVFDYESSSEELVEQR